MDQLTDAAWVDARTGALAADERWEPDVSLATARFRQRRERTARATGRALRLAPVAVLLVVLVIGAFPTTRAAAQRLWRSLRVERTEVVRIRPGRGTEAMRSFRLQLTGPPVTYSRASGVADAARLAGFAPQLIRSPLLGAPAGFSVSSGLRGYTTVDRAELVAALRRLNITATVPLSWDGARLGIQQGPTIVASWPGLTFHQTTPSTVTVPGDFDWVAYGIVGLRIIGLDARDARRIVDRPESLPVVMAASAEDQVEQVSLASGPGTMVRDAGQSGRVQRRTLVWATRDRQFMLAADAACGDCGHLTDDFLIELANSVR
jgi:hypothetical protein